MLFHTMVGSNDIERSKRFYDKILGTLGVGELMRNIADSGHTRLIYSNAMGRTSSSANRSTMNQRLSQTAAPSHLRATRPSR
jgi:catechol 2,3-dioxygenase-like lactoylglutathione lyase family enzyme